MEDLEVLRKELAEAVVELAEIRSKLPAHSIRPHQMMELEEAEERVEDLKNKISKLEAMP